MPLDAGWVIDLALMAMSDGTEWSVWSHPERLNEEHVAALSVEAAAAAAAAAAAQEATRAREEEAARL